MSTYTPVLTLDTLNPAYKRINYTIRGPLYDRASKLEQELAEGVKKQFSEVIRHVGDPQGFGQPSITYLRQVACLLTYPELLNDPKFPKDVCQRAKDILQSIHSCGCYTDSRGLRKFRQEIAEFINKRDGYPSDPDSIYMCNGAGAAILVILKALQSEGSVKAGVMLPVPGYDLYNARLLELDVYRIRYFLDEDNGWSLNLKELKRALDDARPHCDPRALVLINPGNPTGQVLSYENIKEIITFCYEERLVLIADEVYQENVYGEGITFYSCKKVLRDLGPKFSSFQLVSLYSSSKGYMGECGFRAGYYELVGFDKDVLQGIHNRMNLNSSPNTLGQAMLANICNPPQPGDESYETFMKEKNEVLNLLKEKAKSTSAMLNSLEGVKCNEITGAMYAYPRVYLPQKAIEEAQRQGMRPDEFYAYEMLENTGVFVVYGAGLGQREGTYHFRITILATLEKTKLMFKRIKAFHEEFMNKYRD